jgi:two-component system nitrogen regulation sensor histidine kinase NtrY
VSYDSRRSKLALTTDYLRSFSDFTSSRKLIICLSIVTTLLIAATFYTVNLWDIFQTPDPSKVMTLVLAVLFALLSLCSIIFYKFLKGILVTQGCAGKSKLAKRAVIAFSCVTAVPTLTVSIFSIYLFYSGLQVWFDQKISIVLDQSINVAALYIKEHKFRLKESAVATAEDLEESYYDIVHNLEYLASTLNAEVEMRSLDEATVFQRSTGVVLAQTALSSSLAFLTVAPELFDRADRGEAVEIQNDPTKIRILIRLKHYENTYLMVGRLIEENVINHIDQTYGAAATYKRLKEDIRVMQFKFSVIFIAATLLLLLIAGSWGLFFAAQIVGPIDILVEATGKVRAGDLSAIVQVGNLKDDEIKTLFEAFNKMIERLNLQQKELVIAQRVSAWSDVARRVAHEIKNPLTPIQLAAERLSKKFRSEISSDPEGYDRCISMITRNIKDINEIVTEFVNFARLPSPSFQKCELVSLIRDSIDSKRAIEDRILYFFNSSVPKIDWLCDPIQIRQVLNNLLKNAEESLESVRRTGEIKVNLTLEQDLVIINIKDNGVGFKQDFIKTATEAYVTTRHKGMGLGLAIVKKITEDHLGTLSINNNTDFGATVTLTFKSQKLKSETQDS